MVIGIHFAGDESVSDAEKPQRVENTFIGRRYYLSLTSHT